MASVETPHLHPPQEDDENQPPDLSLPRTEATTTKLLTSPSTSKQTVNPNHNFHFGTFIYSPYSDGNSKETKIDQPFSSNQHSYLKDFPPLSIYNSASKSFQSTTPAHSNLLKVSNFVADVSKDRLMNKAQEGIAFKPISSFKGQPAVLFTSKDKQQLLNRLHYVLVGKFSHGRPSMFIIKFFFTKLKLQGSYNLSLLDSKHLAIECVSKLDFNMLWLNLNWNIHGFHMRMFKWEADFNPRKESPIAPVWVTFTGLPIYMFEEKALLSLSNAIGTPIKIDPANVKRVNLSAASVCVELDVSKEVIDSVWVNFEEANSKQMLDGFWVKVWYGEVPPYCSFCSHIGHDREICKRRIELDQAVEHSVDGGHRLEGLVKCRQQVEDFVLADVSSFKDQHQELEAPVNRLQKGGQEMSITAETIVEMCAGVPWSAAAVKYATESSDVPSVYSTNCSKFRPQIVTAAPEVSVVQGKQEHTDLDSFLEDSAEVFEEQKANIRVETELKTAGSGQFLQQMNFSSLGIDRMHTFGSDSHTDAVNSLGVGDASGAGLASSSSIDGEQQGRLVQELRVMQDAQIAPTLGQQNGRSFQQLLALEQVLETPLDAAAPLQTKVFAQETTQVCNKEVEGEFLTSSSSAREVFEDAILVEDLTLEEGEIGGEDNVLLHNQGQGVEQVSIIPQQVDEITAKEGAKEPAEEQVEEANEPAADSVSNEGATGSGTERKQGGRSCKTGADLDIEQAGTRTNSEEKQLQKMDWSAIEGYAMDEIEMLMASPTRIGPVFKRTVPNINNAANATILDLAGSPVRCSEVIRNSSRIADVRKHFQFLSNEKLVATLVEQGKFEEQIKDAMKTYTKEIHRSLLEQEKSIFTKVSTTEKVTSMTQEAIPKVSTMDEKEWSTPKRRGRNRNRSNNMW